MSNRRQIRSGISGTLLVALILGLAVPIISVPAYWILFHTGSWWLPLFFSYLALCSIAGAYVLNRKARVQEHATIGDEMYFRKYPDERKRELRTRRKQGIPETVSQKAEQYRAWPVPVPQGETAEKMEQKRRRGKTLFFSFAGACALLASFLLWGVLTDMRTYGARVPDILILAAAALLLLEMLCSIKKKHVTLLHVATALILGFGTWARLLLVLDYRVSLLPDSRVLETLVCFLLFAILAWTLPNAADRNLKESQMVQTEWELYLDLFEIGSISEADLRFQLEKIQRQTMM